METNTPPPRFSDFSISPQRLALLEKLKLTRPTAIQALAIPACEAGNNLIAIAQTGSGKTLAYALPILHRLETQTGARAVILVPSREVAQQIANVFTGLTEESPLSICLVIGGIPNAQQVSQLKKKPRLIIATPGRLNDHLRTNKLLLQNLTLLVIDEADRMLDMGFMPQLKSIQDTLRGEIQTLMFSASFNPAVEGIARLFMKKQPLHLRTEQAEEPVSGLKQRVLLLKSSQKNDRIVAELKETKGGVMVFCANQPSCEKTGHYLREYGFAVDYIHGGLSQGHRDRVVREFREEKIRVLVTTDLLARGLDFPHVNHVVNFELPTETEDFLHRIGRTARAGRQGTAITFITVHDQVMHKKIKPYLKGAFEITLDPDFSFSPAVKKKKSYNSKKQ